LGGLGPHSRLAGPPRALAKDVILHGEGRRGLGEELVGIGDAIRTCLSKHASAHVSARPLNAPSTVAQPCTSTVTVMPARIPVEDCVLNRLTVKAASGLPLNIDAEPLPFPYCFTLALAKINDWTLLAGDEHCATSQPL